MARRISEIVAHLRAVSDNPSVATTLIQTEDLMVLCDAAEQSPRHIETLHQTIYKAMHERLHGIVSDEMLAGPIWLGTEDAAKAVIASQ